MNAKPPVIRPPPPQIVYVPSPPQKRNSGIRWLKILGWCFGISVVFPFVMIFMTNLPAPSATSNSQVDNREKRLAAGFSSWDGSHRGLTKVIKESMNDPKSYEHVKTVYRDQGDRLIVQTTFRGKNLFGGVVKNWVKAETDLDGNVLKIIAQGP